MKQVGIFLKKEILGSWRNYHVLILIVSFLFFGMLSPLTAKFTPQILEQFIPEDIVFELPKPTSIDSWLQFYKNMSQLQLLIIIIIFSGLLVNERQNQTLPMLLTKGLRSHSIVVGKFLASAIITTLGLFLGFLSCLFYTWFYFKTGLTLSIAFGVVGLVLGFFLVIALFLFFGSLFSKTSGVLLSTLASLALLLVLNNFPKIKRWNPLTVFSAGSDLFRPGIKIANFAQPYTLTMVIIPILLAASVYFLAKREI